VLGLSVTYDETSHIRGPAARFSGALALSVIGSTLNQRFTLDKELGRGGMGAVYRATDQILARTVAIKMLKEASGDEVAKRIRLEAQILARLLHENVVRLYDFGLSDGVYYLVMEEVDGTSFSKRWRVVPLAERLRIIGQVAEALDYAHHQGVIHRDVKPANVLLTASDQAKLSDFGLSTLSESNQESGVVRGTPHYMSPEQARGKRLDHRTDIYSLGVVLYECVTGTPPFMGQNMALLAQHINAEVAPPRFKNPEISPTLEILILNMLAKNPEERPPSGDAVGKALREEVELARNRAAGATLAEPMPPAPTMRTVTIGPPTEPPVTVARDLKPPEPAPAEKPAAVVAPTPASFVKVASPVAREMLERILSVPMMLSADERYLCGHYLAYLLGGSRRQGLFLQRPLDPRNADRARLMVAMTWLMLVGPSDENIAQAAKLLDTRPDIRPALNPVVVMKYLASRANPARRKRFRAIRQRLQDASTHAQKAMLNAKGIMNPGLMPQALDDLRKIAPKRDAVDDLIVERWNRVSEVWRDSVDFRQAVLRYATQRAHNDPASAELWPEVVYPLIERARWQREFRPKHEEIWDYLSAKVLRMPDAGVRLDRIIVKSVPARLAEEWEGELAGFVDDPRIEDEEAGPSPDAESDRLTASIGPGVSLDDLAVDQHRPTTDLIPLAPLDPYRFTQGDLQTLWREAMATLGSASKDAKPRATPVGPYRLAVIPSVRGRSAGQVALQGMPNKQIELLTPSIRTGGGGNRPVIAVWIYRDASAVIVYLDFKGHEKYILWNAPNAQQFNHDHPDDLHHMLETFSMELPDQLDRVLSKKFRPQNTA
jgi:eukaryotic-like serine/threonine-protein kinase